MAAPSKFMPFLEVIAGPQRGQRFPLAVGKSVIGRDESCEVALLDEAASRRHAAIELDGRARLEDMGSANGTRLNGRRIDNRCELADEDQIHLGQTILRYHGGDRRETVILGEERSLSEVTRLDPAATPDPVSRLTADLQCCDGVEELLGAAAGALARELRFARGAIALDALPALAFDGAGRPLGRQFQLSSGLTDRVRRDGQAVLFTVERDSALAERQSIVDSGTTSALCVPLRFRGRTIGLVYLDRQRGAALAAADLALAADLARQIGPAAGRMQEQDAGDELVAVDPLSLALLETADKAAATPAPVLLLGETGVGKERFARRIHQRSGRAGGPFVALNMAALPENLVESELFGHEAGAFTGADRASPGQFRLAHGGTLFLDEIGELPAELQAKLLRALEAQEFYPVGASAPVRVDVRIVAATNQALAQAVREGRFRQDLYYRLAVVELVIPPLRERPADIPALFHHFARTISAKLQRAAPRFDPSFEQALLRHRWPGNVRELRNLIERVLVLAGSGRVGAADLPPSFAGGAEDAAAGLPLMSLKEAERWAILRALSYTGGRKGEAVRLLGTTWPTLNKKIKDHGIDLEEIKRGDIA